MGGSLKSLLSYAGLGTIAAYIYLALLSVRLFYKGRLESACSYDLGVCLRLSLDLVVRLGNDALMAHISASRTWLTRTILGVAA